MPTYFGEKTEERKLLFNEMYVFSTNNFLTWEQKFWKNLMPLTIFKRLQTAHRDQSVFHIHANDILNTACPLKNQ